MRIRAVILTLCIVLVMGLFISLAQILRADIKGVDTVYINSVVMAVMAGEAYTGEKIYPYMVVDFGSDGYKNAVNEAIKNRDTVADAGAGRKVIFYTGYAVAFEQERRRLSAVIVVVFAALTAACAIALIYLQRRFYKPFYKLQKFALSVAAGNLELPLAMDRHNMFGAFSESFDILRTELKAARERTNLADKAKRELIASLSHDIKTPVASIKAVSELLLAINHDERCKPKILTITDKAEQIDRLITDMFNATLEELGELKVAAIEQYSPLLLELISGADYEGRAKVSVVPKCIILVDSLRLGQVFDNVFSNSYKYANTDIDVDFRISNSHLEVDISDSGSGIGEEELPRVFNKFYRGENAGEQSGSGLGLFISKYLMEAQCGSIICFNKDGGFTVRLMIKLAGSGCCGD